MSTTPIDSIAEDILLNTMDKAQAMRRFESLSEQERGMLVLALQKKMAARSGGKVPGRAVGKRLKPVDQRDLNEQHRAFIAELVDAYEKFVPQSKANVLKYQKHFVDQRRAFHLIKDLKPLHFQITYAKAEGAYVHDIDGNRYIDISGDMGVNIFGHKPDFIVDAVKKSLDVGIPLAGYSETIFKACELFSELTGHERVLFTQSGTEAVMFAVRIARAATGRKKIVLFDGSYHGLSDAVAVMRDMDGNSLAMGPGMLQEFADQLIVLEYGNMDELAVIEARDDIAAVLVEPVQSRHPYRQPVAYLHELRKLTLEKDIPLIFDEMITGFRVHTRGAQGLFGIQADIATYGKIPGGGLPTGVIAGAAKYMDLVDGGEWQFDDDSMPKPKRTGMAGTHSQNPLKIASAYAVLSEIKKRSCDHCEKDCSCFQAELNRKTETLAEALNQFFEAQALPIRIDYFGSLFRFRFVGSYWGVSEALFFILLRMKGVETNIQGNCFLTTAHSEEDLRQVVEVVKESLTQLLAAGFFVEAPVEVNAHVAPRLLPAMPAHLVVDKSVVNRPLALDSEQIALLKQLIKADLKQLAAEEV